MPCPICDQKPANCDCTAEERRQYSEIEDLEGEIERQRAERRWIPVEERLPDDGNDVLVRYRYGHRTVCVVAYRVSGNDCWTMSAGDCFDFSDEQTTHWMPLPEPPEVK
jgi:hypothetical protein